MNIKKTDFLGTALASLAKSSTATNGTEFTSTNVKCMEVGGEGVGAILITFTRAAGDGEEVQFLFQGSWDGGVTYTSVYFVRVYVASDADADSNVVKKVEQDLIPVGSCKHDNLAFHSILLNIFIANGSDNRNPALKYIVQLPDKP